MKAVFLSFLTVFIVVLTINLGVAKTPKAKAQLATYSGYMVDKMCSGAIMKDSSSAYMKASAHDKNCLIEPACVNTGFGIVTSDNQWLPFDKAGSSKAKKIALATDKDDHIAVTVKGKMKNGTLYVSQIAEAK